MELTIATWNYCQGTGRKVPVLMQEFGPGVAVVPESSSTPAFAEASLLADGVPHMWTGSKPGKCSEFTLVREHPCPLVR